MTAARAGREGTRERGTALLRTRARGQRGAGGAGAPPPPEHVMGGTICLKGGGGRPPCSRNGSAQAQAWFLASTLCRCWDTPRKAGGAANRESVRRKAVLLGEGEERGLGAPCCTLGGGRD